MKVVFVFCGILLIVIGLPLTFTVEICPAPGLCNTTASAQENALGLAFLIVGACLTAFGLFSKQKPLLKNQQNRSESQHSDRKQVVRITEIGAQKSGKRRFFLHSISSHEACQDNELLSGGCKN